MKTINQSLLLATLGLLLLVANTHATLRTWSGLGADANWLTSANWDARPATNGDSLTFSGSTQQNNTNNFGTMTNTAITLSTGGWSLNGNKILLGGNVTSSTGTNVMNMDLQLTGNRVFSVTAGQLTQNGVLSGAFNLTNGGAGNLVLNGSNTYSGVTYVTAGATAGNVIITRTNGLGTSSVTVAHAGTALGTLQLKLSGSNTIANTFNGFSSANSGATGIPQLENVSGTNTITSSLIVTGTGGNGLLIQSDPGGLLILNGYFGSTQASRQLQVMGAGNGIINGTITNGLSGASFPLTKWGTGTWTLNGTNINSGAYNINQGTIALGASGSISNANPVSLASGAVFDVSALSGGWPLNGGKTLSGSGVVTGSVVAAASGGPVLTPGSTTTQGTLAFSNNLTLGGSTTLNFNLSSDPTGLVRPSDQIVVAGNLSVSGSNTITLGTYLNGYIVNGTYPLIKFGGTLTGDASNFAVNGFAAGGRGVQNGYIITNTGVISLVVTGAVPANLTWRGDGLANNWDLTTTSNWLNGAAADVYYNNDLVTFDDTSTNFTVNLAATMTPGSVVFNATNDYTLAGSDISGTVGVTKTNTGKLTLSVNNSYTGVTAYQGGAIAVATIGNGGAASPLGAAASVAGNQYLNGGTLEYTGGGETSTRAFSIGPNGGTVSVDTAGVTLTCGGSGSWISSAGLGLTKTGPGIIYYSFQQVLTGTNTIKGGIFKIATTSVFGTDVTTPVIVNGGALDIFAQSLGAKPVVASGMGDLAIDGNTNGAIINSSATAQTQGLQFVTLAGDTAFGGTGRWDIRANPTASLSTGGNAYNLIKVGANYIGIVSATVDSALADIDVRAGTLNEALSTTGLGNPAKTLTVENGATFDVWALVNPLNKQIALHDGSTLSSASGTSTIIGPVNLLGDTAGGPTFTNATDTTLNLNGVVSGAGNLTKVGAGKLVLNGTNTYTGTTTVTAGKLVISSAQLGTGSITANDSTTLGFTVSGASQMNADTLTLGTGASAVTNEFTSVTNTATAPIHATNLVVNSAVTVNIASGIFVSGQIYPLIAFDSLSGGGGFVLGALPPLTTATVITNGSTIALNVISSTTVSAWSGAVNGNWDIAATANWKINGAAATYADGYGALFDDTALSNTTVNVTTAVQPKSLTVNNSTLAYAFNGSSISTTGSVTKSGSAALTIYNANSYSGGTTLSAGTLNIDHDGALGTGPLTITGGTIDNNGSGAVTLTNNNAQNWNGNFAFTGSQPLNLGTGAVTLNTNRTLTINAGSLTVGGVVGDGGNTNGLTKSGAGTLVLAGANTYLGITTVNAGQLTLQGNDSAANGGFLVSPASAGGTVLITSNATVTVATNNLLRIGNTSASGTTTGYFYVNGGKVTNNGALLSARNSIMEVYNGGIWLQTGDMTVQGVGGYSGDVYVMPGSTITYAGVNTIKLNGSEGNSGNAYLDVEGLFQTPVAFEQATVSPAAGQGQVWLYGGGTLKLTAAVPELNPIGANPAAVKFVTHTNCGTIDTAGFDTVINNDITGAGGLTKAGAGSLTLNSATPLTYTNDTLIAGGTLILSNSATLNSTNILIGGLAALNVSALATQPYVLANYQVLGNLATVPGTAALAGSVDVAAASAAIKLACASGTPALNVNNGTLTLASTTPVTVSNTGAAFGNGSFLLISTNAGGAVAVTDSLPPVTVTGSGMISGASAVLNLTAGELYLVVSGGSLASTNAYLAGLVLTPAGALSPGFATNQFVYAATNAYTDTPTVTVTNADVTATNTLFLNGLSQGAITSGIPSLALTLNVGSNNVAVRVISQDLSVTNLYTVNVTRLGPPLSTNAYLTSLVLTPGTVTPLFSSNVLSYATTNYLPNNPVTVTAVSADTNATLQLSYNGGAYGPLASATPSGSLTLLQGAANVVRVLVTAQDTATTNLYTLNVTLQPNQTTAPKLTNSVSGGLLNLSWGPEYQGYRLQVQTNNLSKGVSKNVSDWDTVAGSTTLTGTNLPIIKVGVTNEYYRLVYP